jgi:hypothetical protein
MNADTSTPTKELPRKLVRFLVIGSTLVSFLIITPIVWVALTDPKASLPTPLMVVWGVLVIAIYLVIWLRYFMRAVRAHYPNRPRPVGSRSVLDRLFLGIPNEREPGFLAVVVFFVRQIGFSAVAILLLLLSWLFLLRPDLHPQDASATSLIGVLMFGPLVFFEELGRYSFVRRADRPLRALVIFTVATALACVVFDTRDYYAMAWSVSATILASVALYFGLRLPRRLPYVVAALIFAHTAIYVIAPRFDPGSDQSDVAVAKQTPNLAPVAPSVGGMQSWAKLYPGATIIKSGTDKILTLTDWQVEYKVHALPAQIDMFYEDVARTKGFNSKVTILEWHRFTQDSTRDNFSYMIAPGNGGGYEVIFEARAFDN